MITFEEVREFASALPEVEERTSYGTAAFFVRKKLFARMKEDGESLMVKLNFDERELLISDNPEVYYMTDHYTNYPGVLVRLAAVDPDELRDLLLEAWSLAAPKRVLAAYEAERR
jgi:hypothetical protein